MIVIGIKISQKLLRDAYDRDYYYKMKVTLMGNLGLQ
jgi:hypothetical protein